MQIFKLNEPGTMEDVVTALGHSGSIVYPTDTLYGLGVNPFDDFMVRRLFRIKKRPETKPVPLIVNSLSMAKKLAYIDDQREKILKAVWPGAVSVVLKKRDLISDLVSADTDTVSLRIPANDFCMNLVKAFNSPITSTSANISGEDPIKDPEDIFERFKKEAFKPDLIVDAGTLKEKGPSTILDLSGENPRILRVGMVKPEELKRILEI